MELDATTLEKLSSDLKKIFYEHLRLSEELEGHGLDHNGVVLIRSVMIQLYKDVDKYFKEIL